MSKKAKKKGTNWLDPRPPKVPVVEAWADKSADANAILQFIDWLQATWAEDKAEREQIKNSFGDIDPSAVSVLDIGSSIVYEYFDIDQTALERDRRLILLHQRMCNRLGDERKALKGSKLSEAKQDLLILGRLREAEKEERAELGL